MGIKVEHRQTEVGGSRIHFVVGGNPAGPPLFLVHSFYLCHTVYDPYLDRLGEKFFLVIPDLPGFGDSEKLTKFNDSANFAKVLEAVRRELGFKKINLFGFSAGGVVALKYAAFFPSLTWRISVQGTPYYYRDYEIIWRDKIILWFSSVFPHFPKILKRLARYQFVWRVLRFFYRNLDRTMKALGDIRVQKAIISISPQAAYEWGQDVIKIDLRNELKKIACPVQIIIGKRDPYLSLPSVYRMASLLREAEVEIVRGGDHELTIKEPAEIAGRLLSFLENT